MAGQAQSTSLNVADLFAGIGGFRLGLESVHREPYRFTFSNQFEPTSKAQHASAVYRAHWTSGVHVNKDINEVLNSIEGQSAIRGAAPDVIVGGFPCQDYSVARPLSQSRGLAGKRGVLWWSIAQLLQQCIANGRPAKYLIFENVDRLLSSPSGHRGRDFAVILSTLRAFGYAAEWRVINAADYGHAQKRRRVFIVGYHESTGIHQRLSAIVESPNTTPLEQTLLFNAFPCILLNHLDARAPALTVAREPLQAQLQYTPLSNGRSRFGNMGLMLDGRVYTCQSKASLLDDYSAFTAHISPLTLGDIVRKTGPVPTEFYIKPEDEHRWIFAKGAKSTPRNTDGFEYEYKEGKMAFPDPLDRPSRTIITSEGGTTASRTKHAISDPSGRLRRLTPEELEELCGFPRGFTEIHGVSDVARARLIGNSLVVPLVQRIGEVLFAAHKRSLPTTSSADAKEKMIRS